jgi:hypothetical protein
MAKATHGRPRTDPSEVDRLLLDLASGLLAEHFFDPDNEARYLELYPSRRAAPDDPPLAEATLLQDAMALKWRLNVLGQRNSFRVAMRHSAFTANVEGTWQFQRETLRQGRVVQRTGKPERIAEAARSLLQVLAGDEPSKEELDDLLAALSDDLETPLIGDNPREPPPATSAERDHARALVEQLCRKPGSEPRMEDRMWLETTPQTLPVLTDLLVEAMTARPRAESRIVVCLDLVAQQLEFVRYRLDREWDWASAMLNDYQQRLIALGQAGTLEATDWFAMAGALTRARVPVSDGVQLALAEAGMSETPNAVPPDELLATLRGLSDELAEMVESPFEVIEALNAAGAVMPATLRGFMATELALSAHEVLRQAAPLMLLDSDSTVRRAAAAAIEQTAATVSPDSLRRAITIRNWIPQADRTGLDRAIRKVRATGVPIGAWPSSFGGRAIGSRADIAFHASMVDGSGAQSILAISRGGRKGLMAGLLLKQGAGVQDAWIDPAVSRVNINGMLRDMKTEVPSDEVDRSYVDAVVQHAVATGLAQGTVPADKLLAIAEATGGAEWKDRRLDVTAEAERLFDGLAAADRRPDGVQAALERGPAWMQREPIAASWFEDSKTVREVIAKVPRKDNAGAIQLVLSEILPAARMAWAERFLLMAMWCQAATTKAHRAWTAEFVILSHVLTGNVPLETIPVMNSIAKQTVMAARSSGW